MKNAKEISSDIYGVGRQVYLVGLGVAATVNDASKKVFGNLVEKGATTAEKMPRPKIKENALLSRFGNYPRKAFATVGNRFGKTMTTLGVPNREEIQALTRSVEQLTEKVANLQPKKSA